MKEFEDTMRAILSILMVALLLAQATFGLCWHQVDDCAHCPSPRLTAADRCCDSEPDDQQDRRPDEPARGHLECRGFCTFVPAPKTQIDTPQDQVALDAVIDVEAVLDGQVPSPLSWEFVGVSDNHSLPLRLHLLHQLLLI